MISVIVPAHNEASLIRRCLEALTSGAAPGELEVLVVCNGCNDDTADQARAFGGPVRVIESSIPSKSNALNLGDEAARGFPRFYVDADVRITLDAIRQVARELESGKYLAAAPRLEFDLTGRPWSVRAFYRIWSDLPYCRSSIGTGVYALSREGRARFERFPNITADDGFVRLNFKASERTVVSTCSFQVSPPRNLRGIIKIKTRSHFGTIELRRVYPQLWQNEETEHGGSLAGFLKRPTLWPSLAVYLGVRIAARLMAYRKQLSGNHRQWERDDTGRQVISTPAEKAA